MHVRRRNLAGPIALVGVLALTPLWASVIAAAEYDAVTIPPLAERQATLALGINEQGQVVGTSFNVNATTGAREAQAAFIWDATNGTRPLPTLSGESLAWKVNANGQASGYSYNQSGKQRAVRWDLSAGEITDLGTLTNPTTQVPGSTSAAYGTNDAGQVVGSADIPDELGSPMVFHAFLSPGGGSIQDLGTLTTAWPNYQNGYSIAYDVNGSGQIVGTANDDSLRYLPFVYDETNGMRALARDLGYPSGEWYAVAINDAGLIAGHVIVAPHQSRPFYWQNRSAAPTPIPLPAGFPYGEPYGINDAGQVVGVMWASDQPGAEKRAFIFDAVDGVRDLNSLIPAESGWLLTDAYDINDQGQIVGVGKLSGETRGFVLTKVPPAAATLIAPSGPGIAATPTYTWTAVPTATWYYLWVNNGGVSGKLKTWYTAAGAGCGAGTGTCSVTPTTALVGGSSSWWIQTWNSAGYGPWSAGKSFMVNVPPGPVTVMTAPSGTITDPTPTYTWTAVPGATYYYLWVNNGGVSGKLKTWYTAAGAGCGAGTGTCSVTPTTALVGGSSSWWIQTWNSAGYGPWSAAKSFTVNVTPGAVTVMTAPTGTITDTTPTYTWTAVPGATWYYLWVDDSSTPGTGAKVLQWYTAAQAGCGAGAGTCSVTPSTALAFGAAQYWVRTWNSAGYGSWSAAKSFTVGP